MPLGQSNEEIRIYLVKTAALEVKREMPDDAAKVIAGTSYSNGNLRQITRYVCNHAARRDYCDLSPALVRDILSRLK